MRLTFPPTQLGGCVETKKLHRPLFVGEKVEVSSGTPALVLAMTPHRSSRSRSVAKPAQTHNTVVKPIVILELAEMGTRNAQRLLAFSRTVAGTPGSVVPSTAAPAFGESRRRKRATLEHSPAHRSTSCTRIAKGSERTRIIASGSGKRGGEQPHDTLLPKKAPCLALALLTFAPRHVNGIRAVVAAHFGIKIAE